MPCILWLLYDLDLAAPPREQAHLSLCSSAPRVYRWLSQGYTPSLSPWGWGGSEEQWKTESIQKWQMSTTSRFNEPLLNMFYCTLSNQNLYNYLWRNINGIISVEISQKKKERKHGIIFHWKPMRKFLFLLMLLLFLGLTYLPTGWKERERDFMYLSHQSV